jgi:hypothetical protein
MWHGKALALGLKVTQASLRLFERCGGAVALVFDPRQLLAPVAICVGSLRGLVFPLRSAVADFGQLAHHGLSHQDRSPQAMHDRSGRGS